MKKKLLAGFGLILCFSMMACGNSDSAGSTKDNEKSVVQDSDTVEKDDNKTEKDDSKLEKTDDKSENEDAINENPTLDVVGKYTAPEEISDNLWDYTISLMGDMYTFPAPISAVMDNGWELIKDEKYIIKAPSTTAKFKRGDEWLTAYIYDPTGKCGNIDNYFVYSVFTDEYSGDEMEIPLGIKLRMSRSELEEALKDVEYKLEQNPGNYEDSYIISDPDNHIMGYRITVSTAMATYDMVTNISFEKILAVEEIEKLYEK